MYKRQDIVCTYGHGADIAAVINNGADSSPVGAYLSDNAYQAFSGNYIVVHADTVIASAVDHKRIIPVSGI